LGPPALLITCAGIAQPGHFQDIPIDVFETTMAVNYFGTLYSIRAVCKSMVERQQGTILVVSSIAGLIGVYGYSPYCPSKFAVRGLAETLRAELKPSGIQVSIAYPPDTDTPQLAAEAKTKPLATQRISAMAKPWSADAVAQAILKGVQRRDFMITPGFETTLIGKMHSLLAPLSNRYFDSIIAKALAETQHPNQ
ncbi:SDR family NAD(P)-dependent oxidoreductase, partial [Romeria aff. gracilis LEGE 07310]